MNLEKYPLESESDDILLSRLSEECAEVIAECSEIIKVVSKIRRFGKKKRNFDIIFKDLEKLKTETDDVLTVAKEVKRRWR